MALIDPYRRGSTVRSTTAVICTDLDLSIRGAQGQNCLEILARRTRHNQRRSIWWCSKNAFAYPEEAGFHVPPPPADIEKKRARC